MAAGAENGSRAASKVISPPPRLDQKNLKKIAVPMRANGPIVNRGARSNRLDVDEVERVIVGRIAVEMEQRQRMGHASA